MYANTFGAHVSGTIPDVVDRTARVYSNRMSLGHYLIHCAGVIAEDALGQALNAIRGSKVILPSRSRLGPVVHLTIRNEKRHFDFHAEYVATDTPAGAVTELATFHLAEAYIRCNLLHSEGGLARLHVQYDNKQPDWWPEP